MKEESSTSVFELQEASFLNVKVASRRTLEVLAQVDVRFQIKIHSFEGCFLILPSLNSIVFDNPFFKIYKIENSTGKNLLKLPGMTYQLNDINITKQGRRKISKSRYQVLMYQRTVIMPQNQEILYTKLYFSKNLVGHKGTIIPLNDYENSTELKQPSSVVTVGKNSVNIST